jgi:hypothetical protein
MPARQINIPPALMWSGKSTAAVDAIFFPRTGPLLASSITKARRARLTLFGNSGNCEVMVAYQIADLDDEDDWGGTTTIGSTWISAEGNDFGVGYEDLTGDLTKRLVRFGFSVKNKTGTAVETMYASMMLDIREG